MASEDRDTGDRTRRVARSAIAAAIVMAAGYLVLAALAADRSGRVLDLDALDARSRQPIDVTAAGETARLDPERAGLTLDRTATERATGLSLAPATVWRRLAHPGVADLVVHVDRTSLGSSLAGLADRVERPATSAAVTFRGTDVVVTPAVTGRALDQAAAAAILARTWPRTSGAVELPVRTRSPSVGTAAARDAARTVAEPAVSAPVTVVVGDRRAEIPTDRIARHLTFAARSGRLETRIDGAALQRALLAEHGDVVRPARDARVVLRGGRPVVVPGVPGTRIDPEAVAAAVLPALTSADRTARLEVVEVQPEVTTADARALGVREVVGEFSTELTPVPDRTHNITLAARTVNGTLLRPGRSFSLNEVLGPRTAARGYRPAGVIEGNRMSTDYGGGVSQLSTTIYNAVFFSGLRIDEHHAHSLYISRYPEGRETTLNWGTIDLRFTNDSGHGVLVRTWVAGNRVHAQFWGTKKYRVTATRGERRNPTSPATRYVTDPDCTPQAPAPGWTVDVHRIFHALPADGGARLRSQRFTTVYAPHDLVVCGPAPSATTAATPSSGASATPSG